MAKRPVRDEPEPIEAEFEPASGPEPRKARRPGGRPMRSRSATLPELLIASVLSAVLGATVAIIVGNAGSGAPNGTLAREIDNLSRGQADLTTRAELTGTDVVSLRSRLDAQGERLDAQDANDVSVRGELSALTSQLSAVSGAGSGATPAGAAASNSPLGLLLSRINRLEAVVENDKTAPQTTRELQRAIADLSAQVATLDAANTTLVTAFDRREAALAALESGMKSIASDVSAMRGGKPVAQAAAPALPTTPLPVLAATSRSQAIRAFSMLEGAARGDQPFEKERAALVQFLPDETGLAAMAGQAQQGVATLIQLRREFDAAADAAIHVSTNESDDGWNWLRQTFIGVVDFEPAPLVATNAEIVRNARRQLDIGDVHGAVEAVTGLSGGAAGAFKAWRQKGEARYTLDEALRELNARLLGIANSGGSAG